MQLPTQVLPDVSALHLEQIAVEDSQVVLHSVPTLSFSHCPLCGQTSNRVQSLYTRQLADLPWEGRLSYPPHVAQL